MSRGLYIHIPFCRQKCRYCDFSSFSGVERQIENYLSSLKKEAFGYAGQSFDTLYIGGGTPSLLSASQLGCLCEMVEYYFGEISHFTESTCEANPESLTSEKLHVLKAAGLNRLSLGLQSFDDEVLKRIGRIHDVNTFLTTYNNARYAGFENINVDLIAGLPGQSQKLFFQGVEKLVDLQPEHISVYGLQVEEGTVFYEERISPDEDILRAELEKTHVFLEKAGYVHYEISNFARPGYESKHNINYWQNGEYVGLGCAAASYQNGIRRANSSDLNTYLTYLAEGKEPVEFSEQLDGKAHEGEQIMLGLRMLGGVHLTTKQQTLFAREIEDIKRRGLVEQKGDLLKLTLEGLFLANQAFMAFVGPFDEP